MVTAVPDVLARIVEHKRAQLPSLQKQRVRFEQDATQSRRDFRRALVSRQPAIIAEIKKASPSKGLLLPVLCPPRIAAAYAAGGAAALGVLPDERFFKGSLADLESARAAVNI